MNICGFRGSWGGWGKRESARSNWQVRSDETLRGRTRHAIGSRFEESTGVPQCDDCLWLLWIEGVEGDGIDEVQLAKIQSDEMRRGRRRHSTEVRLDI